MTDQSSFFIIVLFVMLFLGALWVAGVGFIYWDLRRRGAGDRTMLLWMAVAVLVPIFGLFAYLFARTLPNLGAPAGASLPRPPRKETLFKRPPEMDNRYATIPAAGEVHASVQEAAYLYTPSQAFTLSVLDGPQRGQTFVLRELPASIGRGSGAFIRLDQDLGVSRQHAELFRREGALWVRDLGSTHGTLVNGRPIEAQPLSPGDEIQVGLSVLRVNLIQG